MALTLTSANTVFTLAVPGLLPPTSFSGWAPEEIYEVEDIDNTEIQMGMDGKLSAGWVPKAVAIRFTLQVNSPFNGFFDTWAQSQAQVQDVYPSYGEIVQPSIGLAWALANGFLGSRSPLASAGRVLKVRNYTVHFESAPLFPV